MKQLPYLLLAILLIGCSRIQPEDVIGLLTSEVDVISTMPGLAEATIDESTSAPSPTLTPYDTSTSTVTSTLSPTVTDTPTETTIPTITLTPTELPGQVFLSPMNHQWQTMNNCHRASIAILMGYYDVWFQQDDYILGMDNLAEFVSDYGLNARVYAVRYAEVQANFAVRWLLAEKIPVIVGQRLSREEDTWHYRVVHGYNDSTSAFSIDDPLLGNIEMTYETFDTLSRGDGQIIPVYPQELDEMVVRTMKNWSMKLIRYPD